MKAYLSAPIKNSITNCEIPLPKDSGALLIQDLTVFHCFELINVLTLLIC